MTSSMNISSQNISGKCNLKCEYSFNYSTSKFTATHGQEMLILTPDKANIPPVTYNTKKYNLENISIYAPSLHSFNGTIANAEILITHTPINGGSALIVCIPITVGYVSPGGKIIF